MSYCWLHFELMCDFHPLKAQFSTATCCTPARCARTRHATTEVSLPFLAFPCLSRTYLGSSGWGRRGEFYHPELGLLSTYVFEQKRNVRFYFHDDTGMWRRLPFEWDLKVEADKVEQITAGATRCNEVVVGLDG